MTLSTASTNPSAHVTLVAFEAASVLLDGTGTHTVEFRSLVNPRGHATHAVWSRLCTNPREHREAFRALLEMFEFVTPLVFEPAEPFTAANDISFFGLPTHTVWLAFAENSEGHGTQNPEEELTSPAAQLTLPQEGPENDGWQVQLPVTLLQLPRSLHG